jgi:TatD DNase family protein
MRKYDACGCGLLLTFAHGYSKKCVELACTTVLEQESLASKMKFINIHAHSKTANSAVLLNAHENFRALDLNAFYSIGLHPWYLSENTAEAELVELREAIVKANVLAIGECGLDRVCETDFELQKHYFIKQIELANEARKPLIIHCVRAFDEVLHLLKQNHVSVPVIFHGFNKNEQVAAQILNSGYLLSFGQKLMFESTAAVFKSIPSDRIFLETDDGCVTIEEVYRMAAEIKGMTIEELQQQIQINTNLVFGENTFLK